MAKIPYSFETPIPKYFRENGWFENENAFKFVTWAFSKCSSESHKTYIFGKEIILEPFEFIAGRLSSPKECFLTEKQFRGIADRMQREGILKKTANSRANKFSCYVWLIERFTTESKIEKGQQQGQLRANRGPTEGHNPEYKNIRIKEDNKNIAQPASRLRSKSDSLSFDFEKWEYMGISEKDIAAWKTIFPHIDLTVEITKSISWLKSNPSKSNKSLWRKFLTGWLQRANDSIENKRAFKAASGGHGADRRTKDAHGNPVESQYKGRF